MPSLLVVIFVVELVVQLINTIGATTINDLIWRLYLALPTPLARQSADQRKKQKEYLAVRLELNATSSQDEFAKWAKLRRQHDKLLDELEKKKSGVEAARTKFDRYLTGARLVSTRGVQWVLPWWYGKEPMFWLPYGWFPYYMEWFASFPRAPLGSVSIVVWQCRARACWRSSWRRPWASWGSSRRAGNHGSKSSPSRRRARARARPRARRSSEGLGSGHNQHRVGNENNVMSLSI